ncbi:restriction endonuclease subunit S [Belliella sp. R4-6]|uniref:Restriction endonuclease subunit S n=1 Tax=Belliella alkalica TaxID=1730871 RepID=A0ABS9VGK3_9BACT|nr:restriction endonuclease subunit S [Belliella alkalica]MCH7415299.1 restriction endonuclease subunit S [Belliella alkalica]
MSTDKLIPEFRFPEFLNEGEWKEKQLGEIAEIKRGAASQHLSYVEDKSKGIRLLRINDFLSDTPVYVKDSDDIKRFRVKTNDLLIAGTGATAGITFIVPEEFNDLAYSYNAPRIRLSNNDNFFIYNYLKSDSILNQQRKLFVGNAQPFLDTDAIRSLKISIPKLLEQQKIASCLFSLDELIAAQSQKLDVLKDHKKGLMQNLFPQAGEKVPKYRFNEFEKDGEWVEKKFQELFDIGNGRDYKHLEKGEIPVYGSGGYMLSVDDYLYDGESVCIGRKGTIDKPMFLSGKFWTVDTLFFTHSFKDCLPKYIFYVFENINWRNHNEAGGVPSLSKTNIYKIEIMVPPTIQEQQKIASCLSSLDALIAAQGEKIEQLQLHKKGLMQGLFPKIND